MTFNARGLYAASSKVPRKRRSGWLVLGAIIGLLALGIGALSIFGSVATSSKTKSDMFPAASEVVIDNQTVGKVTVMTVTEDHITVERELRGSKMTDPDDRINELDDRLEIKGDCKSRFVLGFGFCAVDYLVKVPEGAAFEITTNVGAIDVTGVVGDVRAESDTGSITLRDVEGSIDLKSDTGSIEADGSGAVAAARSDTGKLNLERFEAAEVNAGTDTGSILVGAGFTTATIESDTGSVSVRTDQEFESLRAKSDTGAVDIRVPDTEYRVTGESDLPRRAIEVDTSPDASALIEAVTATGRVSIKPY